MEKGNKGAGLVRVPPPKHQLPNGINLHRLAKLLAYSDRYQINIQFWPKQIAVYIIKDMKELKNFGGDFDFAIEKSIEYLDRINQVKQ